MEDNNYYNIDRKIINIKDLHPYTVNAFIDIEDKRFYSHNGYDLKRIAKSSLVNLKNHSKKQGASTITQQLVKNTLLSNEKTYKRKLNEIMLAIKVEKNFSKEEILNMYLNSIYFGSNAYGIENASNVYFNKSAKELTINESAILAGIIKSPRLYSPKYNQENCKKRKNLVLRQMLENKHITQHQYEENCKLDVECSQIITNYDNTYFQQAINEACKVLKVTEKELIRSNYQIITYMDSTIQENLQQEYQENDYSCDKLGIVASTDGKVLAYLGISPYDLTDMKRTPASALKPLAVYLPCVYHNICTSQTPILDEATDFNGYQPKNTGNEYLGWTTVGEAVAKSKNIPSVKLLNSLGIDNSIDFLDQLDIKTCDADKSLALALGSLTYGVSPIDLLSAYTVFANGGKQIQLKYVEKILDKNGRTIYENNSQPKEVCDAESAYIVNEMLVDTAKNGTAKMLSNLNIPVASKTGTNYVDSKTLDLWNVAYTSDKLVLCWLGSSNNEGLNGLSSSFSATKINKNILEKIYENTPPADFEIPEEIVSCDIDLLELEHNHILKLASMYTPERYKQTIDIKSNFDIEMSDSFYAHPNTNFDVKICNYGAEICFDTTEIFDYKLTRNVASTTLIGRNNLVANKNNNSYYGTADNQANNMSIVLSSYQNSNSTITFIDDKVFGYEEITYTLTSTNKYTNQVFEDTVAIFPKQFLRENMSNQGIYNTKPRWYV